MSANDSSTLIDSPVPPASSGPNRALYFSEEEGRLEKFRPYGLPTDDWLDATRAQFGSRPLPEPRPEPEPLPAPSGNGNGIGNGETPKADDEPAPSSFGSPFSEPWPPETSDPWPPASGD